MVKSLTILLFTIVSLTITDVQAQIINPDFNNWHWITFAQPYQDPVGWTTNNDNEPFGLANTPVEKIGDTSNFLAVIRSNYNGIDAVLSGEMSQRFPVKNISHLNIISRCDSLFGTGKCIIEVTGHDYTDVLYVDSIGIEESEFQTRVIDIPGEWGQHNDSITIRFVAKGNLDIWDDEDDGYSIFYIDRVKADQRFLVPGRQWIYAYNTYDYLPDPLVAQSIESITIGQDTSINGFVYSKIYATRLSPCNSFAENEYLREEDSKIYRLSHDQSQEFLMIDFNETVGYQMLYDDFEGSIDTATVIIDSMGTESTYDGALVDVQYVHILNNNAFDDETEYKVYQNVGFVQYGILFPELGTGLCEDLVGLELRCFVDGVDTLHFTELGCYENELIDAIHYPSRKEVVLAPNPCADIISIPEGFHLKQAFNMQGQNMKLDRTENELFINPWPPGIYFLEMIKDYSGEIWIGRIMRK